MRSLILLILLLTASVCLQASSSFGVPPIIHYQGRLTGNEGQPLDTVVDMTFTVYDDEAGSNALWTETHPAVPVGGGNFAVLLGDITPFPETLFTGPVRFFGITIGAGPELPQLAPIVSVVYAMKAAFSDEAGVAFAVGGDVITGENILNHSILGIDIADNGAAPGQVLKWDGENWVPADDEGGAGTAGGWTDAGTVIRLSTLSDSVGIGTSAPLARLDVIGPIRSGYGNNLQDSLSVIGGGFENYADSQSVVAGGAGNFAYKYGSTVGGGLANSARASISTIAGGHLNEAYGSFGTVGGGYHNWVYDVGGTIAGGQENEARGTGSTIGGGGYNRTLGPYSVIGGGGGENPSDSNVAIGMYSVIGGGHDNAVSGEAATIGGGYSNGCDGAYSVVVGGVGNWAPANTSTIGGGSQNVTWGQGAAIAGGVFNYASGMDAAIGGGCNNAASGDWSVVAGGGGNCSEYDSISNIAAGNYSVVSGGHTNHASGHYSVTSGGHSNEAIGDRSTIGGGFNNSTGGSEATVSGGQDNHASGAQATVSGGQGNTAQGWRSAIGGGVNNTATGPYSAVFSGVDNSAGNDDSDTAAFVGGGCGNVAQGKLSVVCGGGAINPITDASDRVSRNRSMNMANYALGPYNFVGGGRANETSADYSIVTGGAENEASANYATTSGGYVNRASGEYTTISGGTQNRATAIAATVGGGEGNVVNAGYGVIPGGHADTIAAGATYSMAVGRGVYVGAAYRTMFYDGNNYGAVGINRDSRDGGVLYPIHVGTNTSNGNGAHLTAGGVWTNGSSRTLKENFSKLDESTILSKIRSLSVTAWNYKGTSERHIGPVAEDFVAAFDVGSVRESDGLRDDKYLATGDVAGVALIGVQELVRQNDDLRSQVAELSRQVEELKAIVTRTGRD